MNNVAALKLFSSMAFTSELQLGIMILIILSLNPKILLEWLMGKSIFGFDSANSDIDELVLIWLSSLKFWKLLHIIVLTSCLLKR